MLYLAKYKTSQRSWREVITKEEQPVFEVTVLDTWLSPVMVMRSSKKQPNTSFLSPKTETALRLVDQSLQENMKTSLEWTLTE